MKCEGSRIRLFLSFVNANELPQIGCLEDWEGSEGASFLSYGFSIPSGGLVNASDILFFSAIVF